MPHPTFDVLGNIQVTFDNSANMLTFVYGEPSCKAYDFKKGGIRLRM